MVLDLATMRNETKRMRKSRRSVVTNATGAAAGQQGIARGGRIPWSVALAGARRAVSEAKGGDASEGVIHLR